MLPLFIAFSPAKSEAGRDGEIDSGYTLFIAVSQQRSLTRCRPDTIIGGLLNYGNQARQPQVCHCKVMGFCYSVAEG